MRSNRHGIDPHIRADSLAKIDARTTAGRILTKVRSDLIAHCGGTPSVAQKLLIERAAAIALHLARLDAAATASGMPPTGKDAQTYLTYSNSYARLVKALVGVGSKPEGPNEPSLAEAMAAAALPEGAVA
jgi:hypothetical protein